MSERDEGVVGVGTTVKRGNELTNTLFEIKINFTGKYKKEKIVGEEGDDKDVDKKNAGRDRKGGNDGLARVDTFNSLLEETVENIA